MKISFHRNFKNQYKKLKAGEKRKTQEKLEMFLKDSFHPILNNHPLKGKYLDYRSINIAGDLRAIYKFIDNDNVIFVAIDTHSNLYR